MVIAIITTVAFIILLLVVLYYRWRMTISKAKFAFSTVSALLTCLLAFFALVSVDLPQLLLGAFVNAFGFNAEVPGQSLIAIGLAALLTIIAMRTIYKFASKAILNWEAPARVSENELAKEKLEHSIPLLAASQLRLFLKRQADPVASDYISAWEKKFSEAPKAVENSLLLRDLFTSYMREANLPNEGWRDANKLWVGGLYSDSNTDADLLYVLIFDEKPNDYEVKDRIDKIQINNSRSDNCKIFGLYSSRLNEPDEKSPFAYKGKTISFLSSRQMILGSLDLRNYARELLRQYTQTKVGGTDATLANSFVELDAFSASYPDTQQKLSAVIDAWVSEDSARHLAITGEYGQGKSTAMLKYCCDWAQQFLKNPDRMNATRVPLLIELRGRNPSETDALAFISTWCARYGLQAEQVLNLIKSGGAIVIFEGFDELRNSGRAYDRHQHFNALWRFAYPHTKVIFTGRPNFFLDNFEANRTLRTSDMKGAAGEAYTEIWRLSKLNRNQIEEACRSFKPQVRDGVLSAVDSNLDFLEIVSRPSMLPVVATIWDEIEDLCNRGSDLTGALLIERYLQAIYARKEAELERDRVRFDAPTGSRYLVLPKPVRELLTVCVAWRMAGLRAQNTIPRNEINMMIGDLYSDLIILGKSENVSPQIMEGLVRFEKRYESETLADKVEIITSEICSAGLLIPDPAGGISNLRFPHKQFYEYLICKGFCICSQLGNSGVAKFIQNSSPQKDIFVSLLRERNAIIYLAECVGSDISKIWGRLRRTQFELFAILFYVAAKVAFKISRIKNVPNQMLSNSKDSRSLAYYEGSVSDLMLYIVQRSVVLQKSFFWSFIVSIGLVASLSVGAMFFELDTPTIFDIPRDKRFILFIVFGTVLAFLMSIYGSNTLADQYRIFVRFVVAHWERVDAVPTDWFLGARLILNTLRDGRVQFYDGQVVDGGNIANHISPAADFGERI